MLSLVELLLNYSKMTYFHPAMTGSLLGYMVGDAAGLPFDGRTREEMRKSPMKKVSLSVINAIMSRREHGQVPLG